MRSLLLLCTLLICLVAVPSSALAGWINFDDTWTLNTHDADGVSITANGSVSITANGIDLLGNDDGVEGIYTTYTKQFAEADDVTFDWKYTTWDRDGSAFDPAGYVLDGAYHKLTVNGFPKASNQMGTETVSVGAGQTFGFYVYSNDGDLGPGELAIATPEPATFLMLGTGLFGLIGFARRFRN